jgi:flagellar hook-associated protein 3 FlgL
MALTTVGDMAQAMILSRRNGTLKDQIQTLMTESTTGLSQRQDGRVRGDFVPLAGIESSLRQIEAYRRVATETGAMAGHMQIAIDALSDSTSTFSASILAATSSHAPARIDTLGREAEQRLDAALSSLHMRMGARSLFAGQATDGAAVADGETLLTALDGVIAGALSSADVETALDDWFADPLGFAATIYQGGDTLAPVPVGRDQEVAIDVTARDPALVGAIKGLAMAALLARGILSGSDVARADLAKRAGESLASNQVALAELGARLGATEATIVAANVQNDTEKSALEIARLGLLSVDPYETATRLQEAQTQLETLFSITARMSRLSLTSFL